MQIADSVCIGVGSATHQSRKLKSSVSGLLRLDELSSNLDLDVTVILQNTAGFSHHSYSRFLLTAVEGPKEVAVEEVEAPVEVIVEGEVEVVKETVEPTPNPTEVYSQSITCIRVVSLTQ